MLEVARFIFGVMAFAGIVAALGYTRFVADPLTAGK